MVDLTNFADTYKHIEQFCVEFVSRIKKESKKFSNERWDPYYCYFKINDDKIELIWNCIYGVGVVSGGMSMAHKGPDFHVRIPLECINNKEKLDTLFKSYIERLDKL